MLTIKVEESPRGLLFRHGRKRYALAWPDGIWQTLPEGFREVLADNLAHLLTIDLPLVAESKGVTLNRPRPCFWAQFRDIITGGIPQAVEVYKPSTTRVLERFRNMHYRFESDIPRIPPQKKWNVKPRAVVLFSSGADSLASLGLAREMGLDPIPVYIDDTVSPGENRIKRRHLAKLREMGFPAQLVMNRVERLNDFENWSGKESCLGYMHMVTGFALMALPIAWAFRARYIILGNEQDMNWPFINKDGFLTYPSFDQTSSWTMQLDMMTRTLTGGAVRVTSLIEPLAGLGVAKLLFGRYPELAGLLVSCDGLDASKEPRWCQRCATCAQMALRMRAVGFDPAAVGIRRDMLSAGDARYYSVFDGRDADNDQRSPEAKEMQELCFLLAVERGVEGKLVERFRMRAARPGRRAELLKKYLKPYSPGTIPVELRDNLLRILKEALAAR